VISFCAEGSGVSIYGEVDHPEDEGRYAAERGATDEDCEWECAHGASQALPAMMSITNNLSRSTELAALAEVREGSEPGA
jgi:NADPH-dependent ferric siderophore reductase